MRGSSQQERLNRIAVESAAATPLEHPTTATPDRPALAKAQQTHGLEEMIQALSEAVQACIQA